MAIINGTSGSETLNGTTGDDVINAFGGSDSVNALQGDDTIFGGSGSDELGGDAGNDTIYGGSGYDFFYGGSGNDVMFGDSDTYDDFYGGSGNDTIYAGNFDDNWLYGGADDDMLFAGSGDESLDGGTGNDTLYAGAGADTVIGGDGDDLIQGQEGDDTLYGGNGNDLFELTAFSNSDIVEGGNDGAVDTLSFIGSSNASVSFSNTQEGTYTFGSASGSFIEIEAIETDAGDDVINASASSGSQTVTSNAGNDTIFGGSANDTLFGGDDNDEIDGQLGRDEIYGGSGADTLDGGGGNDSLYGGIGDDDLQGSANDDVLFGGAGNDTLAGGDHNDTLTGGSGNDLFVQSRFGNDDTIVDFDLSDGDGDGFYNDQLDVSQLQNGSGGGILTSDVTPVDIGGGNVRLDFPEGESITLLGVSFAQMSSLSQLYAAGIPCFTAGTLIDVPSGLRPVEDIAVGDYVNTRDNGPQRVIWTGRRHLTQQDLVRDANLRPVRLAPDAIGNSKPILVSRQHGMLMKSDDPGGGEQLIRAVHLARMKGGKARIAWGVRAVHYVHLLFEHHQVIYGDGIPSESFYPGPSGLAALARPEQCELEKLFPELITKTTLSAYGGRARKVARFRNLPRRLSSLRPVT